MCTKRMWLALGAAAAIALVVTPGPGVLGSFALLAACPLMMLAMTTGVTRRRRPGTRSTAPDDAAPNDADELTALRAEVAELRSRVER
jgi:hypothetical protein